MSQCSSHFDCEMGWDSRRAPLINPICKDTSNSNDGHIYEDPGEPCLQKHNTLSLTKSCFTEYFHSKNHTYLIPESPIDPVSIFDFYLKKLNKANSCLWQCPKRKVQDDEEEWYENAPVGKHPLESFMKKLSKGAGLSMMYTNHCIRATVISNLDKAGFKARHIKAISGHKSDETIKSYATHCPDFKKREMSDALTEKFKTKKAKTQQLPSTTITKPNPEEGQLSTINFNEIVDFVPIDNNAQDFDIGTIIQQVEDIEKHPQNSINIQLTSENAVTPITQPVVAPQQNFQNPF